jgi:hypothetical protein
MSSPDSRGLVHATQSTNLADLIERLLDKGVVISGDIRVKLVDIELLTIQIRLVICSVDRAVEMGMDWWRHDAHFSGPRPAAVVANAPAQEPALPATTALGAGGTETVLERILDRLDALERRLESLPAPSGSPDA